MRTAPSPVIVLVDHQLGENIGMVARAMANMGLSELRLVRQRDGWPSEKAEAAASGALDIINGAVVFASLAEAIVDTHFVYATSARERAQAKIVVGPRAAARALRGRIEGGQRAAIVFGPERAGLSSDDVALADEVLTLPVNPAFASLNLAQAVLLVGYEWFTSLAEGEQLPFATELGAGPATREAMAGLVDHLERELDEAGFFGTAEKKIVMSRNLRNILHRRGLTEHDVRTLRGVINMLSRKRRKDEAEGAA